MILELLVSNINNKADLNEEKIVSFASSKLIRDSHASKKPSPALVKFFIRLRFKLQNYVKKILKL